MQNEIAVPYAAGLRPELGCMNKYSLVHTAICVRVKSISRVMAKCTHGSYPSNRRGMFHDEGKRDKTIITLQKSHSSVPPSDNDIDKSTQAGSHTTRGVRPS